MVAAKKAPEPPNTRLAVGDYIADILLDARANGTIYHWIVQRVGLYSLFINGVRSTLLKMPIPL